MFIVKQRNPRISRITFLLLSLLLSAASFAQMEVGGGVHYGNSLTVNAHAVVPLFSSPDLAHSVRPQVTYAFEGLPAVSVSYVLTGTPEDSRFDRYLGVGAGLSFPGGSIGGVLFSVHALAGGIIPISKRVNAFTEVTLTTSSLATRIALGAGIRYRFGGSQ